jgi:TolA-binding protein
VKIATRRAWRKFAGSTPHEAVRYCFMASRKRAGRKLPRAPIETAFGLDRAEQQLAQLAEHVEDMADYIAEAQEHIERTVQELRRARASMKRVARDVEGTTDAPGDRTPRRGS